MESSGESLEPSTPIAAYREHGTSQGQQKGGHRPPLLSKMQAGGMLSGSASRLVAGDRPLSPSNSMNSELLVQQYISGGTRINPNQDRNAGGYFYAHSDSSGSSPRGDDSPKHSGNASAVLQKIFERKGRADVSHDGKPANPLHGVTDDEIEKLVMQEDARGTRPKEPANRISASQGMATPKPPNTRRTKSLRKMLTGGVKLPKRLPGMVLPTWMSEALINETNEMLTSVAASEKRAYLRGQNLTMQTELRVWTTLVEMDRKLREPVLGKGETVEALEQSMIDFLRDEREAYAAAHPNHKADWLLLPDPVGAVPLHQVFLLGMVDLGKKIAQQFYNTPELISVPYGSDMALWKDLGLIAEHDGIDDGGLYTGETVLHIAIVNQNVQLVEWLLERGINLGSRALGAFFKPAVLRKQDKTRPSLWRRISAHVQNRNLKNDPFFTSTPNSDSACYYGEFPLSFAASMGNIEICTLLRDHMHKRIAGKDEFVAKQYDFLMKRDTLVGRQMRDFMERTESKENMDRYRKEDLTEHAAFKPNQPLDYFINAQDSLGNTAMHLAVMFQHKHVIDWLMKNAGRRSLTLLNDDGFTPFTLAARLGLVEVFHHLANHMRETVWSYGNVHMSKTSLEQIDTFRIEGMQLHTLPKWRSALEIIVRHEVEAFANDEVFNKLISDKWERFGRKMYFRHSFVPYTLILIIFTVMLSLLCQDKRIEWLGQLAGTIPLNGDTGMGLPLIAQGKRTLLQSTTSILRTIMVAGVSPWLLYTGWKTRRLGPKDYDPNEDGEISAQELMLFLYKNMNLLMNFMSAITIVIAYALAYAHDEWTRKAELQVWAVTSVVIWCNFLNIIMPFKFFGILVIIIYKMIIGDFFKFLIVYVIMLGGFSQAMFCLFQLSDFPDHHHLDLYPGEVILKLIWASVGDVDQLFLLEELNSPQLPLLMYMIWVMVAAVLLINLLIAMMGQTFDSDMEDTHKSWIFPFSHLVLMYEDRLSEDQKITYRSGRPGHTDYGDSNAALRQQVFFQIVIEEDKARLAHSRLVKEQKKAHRLSMNVLTAFADSMTACTGAVKDMASNINKATGVGIVRGGGLPERVRQWLPKDSCNSFPVMLGAIDTLSDWGSFKSRPSVPDFGTLIRPSKADEGELMRSAHSPTDKRGTIHATLRAGGISPNSLV